MEDVFSYKDCDIVTETMPITIKDIDGKKGVVTGYFAHFDSIDSDGDIIKKGSFIKTLSEQGPFSRKPRIKHLLNHDTNQPLGVLTDLREDNYGLFYESKLGTHSLGEDFVKMVESGLITEHSIGYRTKKWNQLKPWSEWKEGEAMREITEVKLYEGSSLTAWGANMNTPLTSMKAEKKVSILCKQLDALMKALRNGSFTDETFDLLEIKFAQLQQLYIDLLPKEEKEPPLQGTPEPDARATHPAVVKSRNWGSITQLLN